MLRYMAKSRLAKYALVGGLNTGVDFAVFVILVYAAGFTSVWAQAIAYSAGLANSYFLNRYWTFQVKKRQQAGDLARFVAVNAVSFAAATTALLLLEKAGLSSVAAKIFSVGLSLAVNYAGYRLWVFREAVPAPAGEG